MLLASLGSVWRYSFREHLAWDLNHWWTEEHCGSALVASASEARHQARLHGLHLWSQQLLDDLVIADELQSSGTGLTISGHETWFVLVAENYVSEVKVLLLVIIISSFRQGLHLILLSQATVSIIMIIWLWELVVSPSSLQILLVWVRSLSWRAWSTPGIGISWALRHVDRSGTRNLQYQMSDGLKRTQMTLDRDNLR